MNLSRTSLAGGGGHALAWHYHFCSVFHDYLVYYAASSELTPPPPAHNVLTLWQRYAWSDARKQWVAVRITCCYPGRSRRSMSLWSSRCHISTEIQDTLVFNTLFGVLTASRRSWNMISEGGLRCFWTKNISNTMTYIDIDIFTP